MNTENLIKLRDVILMESTKYDQRQWSIECSTPSCLGGHAAVLDGYIICSRDLCHRPGQITKYPILEIAGVFLDLTPREKHLMFDACPLGPWWSPNRQTAAKMLDHAIEYGKVRWKKEIMMHSFTKMRDNGRMDLPHLGVRLVHEEHYNVWSVYDSNTTDNYSPAMGQVAKTELGWRAEWTTGSILSDGHVSIEVAAVALRDAHNDEVLHWCRGRDTAGPSADTQRPSR